MTVRCRTAARSKVSAQMLAVCWWCQAIAPDGSIIVRFNNSRPASKEPRLSRAPADQDARPDPNSRRCPCARLTRRDLATSLALLRLACRACRACDVCVLPERGPAQAVCGRHAPDRSAGRAPPGRKRQQRTRATQRGAARQNTSQRRVVEAIGTGLGPRDAKRRCEKAAAFEGFKFRDVEQLAATAVLCILTFGIESRRAGSSNLGLAPDQ